MGHHVIYETIAKLLREVDYSLQATKKSLERMQHEERDAQFRYINDAVMQFRTTPVPSP